MSETAKSNRKGRVLVITGTGKGKTSSALGVAIRASGQGFKVLFLQFIKKESSDYGEHRFFKKLDDAPFLLKPIGLGFKFGEDLYEQKDIDAAQNWKKELDNFLLSTSDHSKALVVLDEISYPLNYKWLDKNDILEMLGKYDDINFILTGRDMLEDIVTYADTVSEIKEIKHAYQEGRDADIGVEF